VRKRPPDEDPDAARYLTPTPVHRSLGLVCLGVGGQRGAVPPCTDRTLAQYAAVFVTAGRGWLRDAVSGDHLIAAPCVFWLRPGVEHSYGPDAHGWAESWVLFDGPDADVYARLGYLPVAPPLSTILEPGPVARAFARLDDACQLDDPHLAAAAAVHDLLVTINRCRGGTESAVLALLRRNACGPWSVAEHARRLAMPEATLRAAVRDAAGCSPKEYLLGVRLTLAKELLAGTTLTVAAVARRVGYGDAGYFTRLFTRRVGVAPSTFRAQQAR
jgi:AraC-like DNA-binding protein